MDDRKLIETSLFWVERMKKLYEPKQINEDNNFLAGTNFIKELVSRDLEALEKILNDDWSNNDV